MTHVDAPGAIMAFARRALTEHGLHGWTVRWDRAKRRAGSCSHAAQTITLSRPLAEIYPDDIMRDVVLHEVAHALAGPSHRHDETWRRIATSVGATPSALLPATLPQPDAAWIGTCPACGKGRSLHSMPRRVVSCGRCERSFDRRLILEWTHRGTPTQPGGRYAAELRRIHR